MTSSVTPRITSEHTLFGLPSKVIAGVDFYDSIYQQDRGLHQGDPPIHSYRLRQSTLAGYGQDTIALLPTTDLTFGGRVQQHRLIASDVFDPTAPTAPFAFELGGLPLDKTETHRAWHVGIEHRFNGMVAIFGRAAQSFRTPNVDERVGMAPFATATNFDLRTQTSRDIEGGVRITYAKVDAQWSVYDMALKDELHFSPDTFTNTNLDPTHRYGSELSTKYQLSDNARLTGGVSYTRAVFREGAFAGNDVPLVSRWTGNIGGSWDIWAKYLTLDGIVRYVGPRRMDNDQTNRQPMIPAHTVVDVRLGGVVDRLTWSVSVQNLFNAFYFDYAVASAFTLGTYNAYPLPGRTFMVKAGATF
jgi:iron complex outermembrane receptor protein